MYFFFWKLLPFNLYFICDFYSTVANINPTVRCLSTVLLSSHDLDDVNFVKIVFPADEDRILFCQFSFYSIVFLGHNYMKKFCPPVIGLIHRHMVFWFYCKWFYGYKPHSRYQDIAQLLLGCQSQ